jgi:hypothetical protein
MPGVSQEDVPSAGAAPAPLRWRSWPFAEHARRSALVLLGLVAAGAVVYGLTGRVHLVLLALASLLLALWRFFLPVEFGLSDGGVDQRVLGRKRRIPWQVIARYQVCDAGVLLLPDEDRSPLVSFRGLYLPFSGYREEILAHVRRHLDRPTSA